MAFAVEITDAALRDAEEYVEYIRVAEQQPRAGENWWRGLLLAIYSLQNQPRRCPVIPEAFDVEVRHLLYHSHRIVFRVQAERNAVVVLRIYHGKRRRLAPADVQHS